MPGRREFVIGNIVDSATVSQDMERELYKSTWLQEP